MARTYRCAEFELDVPVEWQQQILHLLHPESGEGPQVLVAEAPSAYLPLEGHERFDEISNHVAEYALARTLASAEFVKAQAVDPGARLLSEEVVVCRGALGHRIDYQWTAPGASRLRYRELHLVRGRLYVRVQAVLAGEGELATLERLFEGLVVVPDPRRRSLWVDPEWDIRGPVEIPPAPPLNIDRSVVPAATHPRARRAPSGAEPAALEPLPRRLEYILQFGAGGKDAAAAPPPPAAAGEEELGPGAGARTRLERFLRLTAGSSAGTGGEEEE